MDPRDAASSLPPALNIRRGVFQELTLYEVEESELELLARGSPDSLYLNFSILLLSFAVSFLISLLTAILSDRVFHYLCRDHFCRICWRDIAYPDLAPKEAIDFEFDSED